MKKISLLPLFILFVLHIKAQDFDKAFDAKKAAAKAIAADNVANPNKNFKSIVTDLFNGGNGYYQALIKNGIISQGDGEVQVKSTIYGIIRIFDSTKREDTYFKKLRWARNTQIGLGAVLGEGNKINAFNSSATIAIINKRVTNWKTFNKKITKEAIEDLLVNVRKAAAVADALANKTNKTAKDSADSKKADEQIDDFGETLDFTKLKGLITDEEIDEAKTKWEKLTKEYDDIKKKISGAPLLTYGYEGNYGNKKWTKLNNKVEFLAGFGSKKDSVRNYDFYAGAFYNATQDTLNVKSSLNRKVFNAKIGINKILAKSKLDGSSLIEAFGGGEFENISEGLYANEVAKSFKFNLSLSFRIAQNLYLPFQVKWNTVTGRFEGFVNLKFDVLTIFK